MWQAVARCVEGSDPPARYLTEWAHFDNMWVQGNDAIDFS